MKKFIRHALCLTVLLSLSSYANAKGKHNRERINRGSNDGSLTSAEERDLREDRRDVREERRELRKMREEAREDGVVSADERAEIREQHHDVREDRRELSQDIHEKRHNNAGVNNSNKKGLHLQRRLNRGDADNSLTDAEAADLREDLGDIREERRELKQMRQAASVDGVVSDEERAAIREQRHDVREDRREMSRDLYEQRHDDEGVDRDDM